jgi:hypothetical protein
MHRQPGMVLQVEKDRAAADKRFNVAMECRREEGLKLRDKLLFPAHPFEKWF